MDDEKRIMFEIYREPEDGGAYKAVYFTELGEHERELEIGNAIRGDHVFDGFILSRERLAAKRAVNTLLDRLNNGEQIDDTEIARTLSPFVAS